MGPMSAVTDLDDWRKGYDATLSATAPISIENFYAHMPDHRYIFEPTRDTWPASSIDSRLPWPAGPDGKPIRPSKWLDEHQPIEQMTWAPGETLLIRNKLIDGGGWVDHPGCTAFNLYRPPAIRGGNARDVEPWLDHVRCVYPHDFLDRAFAPTARSVIAAGDLDDLEIFVGDLNGRRHRNDFGDHCAGSSIQ
jgi:hypothetical protein